MFAGGPHPTPTMMLGSRERWLATAMLLLGLSYAWSCSTAIPSGDVETEAAARGAADPKQTSATVTTDQPVTQR